MGATRDCKHGQLARSCEICGLEADLESQAEYIKELQARLAWLQKTLTGRQRRHYASALRQLRNFRDGLREARALYAEKSGKPDRFDDPSAWWQNPRDKSVVLWLIEWAEDVQTELMGQLGKERDALAAEVERLRATTEELLMAIKLALKEIGFPNAGYPAPLVNAGVILKAVLDRAAERDDDDLEDRVHVDLPGARSVKATRVGRRP